ncbi:retrovirus-related pol polyprotein from transposon TNT 1-94 [Tanacetum coccineum]
MISLNILNNEDTPLSSSIIVEDHEAPQLVSLSEEPIANEPSTPVLKNHSNELVQEDIAELDGNTYINPFCTPVVKEAESSSNYQDPSNMHEFYQKHRSTDIYVERIIHLSKHVGKNIIAVKWLWKNKTDAENTVIQNKSRLVAKGYCQEEGIDFDESFSLVE